MSKGDSFQPDSNTHSLPDSTPNLVHEGDVLSSTLAHKGGNVDLTRNLGMSDFPNPDTIGLRWSSRPHKPRTLSSLFLLFVFMTISSALQPLLDLTSVAQAYITYFSDLS